MSDAAFGERGADAGADVDAEAAGAVRVSELRHTHRHKTAVVGDGLRDLVKVTVSWVISVDLHGG
jgi:hypothetical protein